MKTTGVSDIPKFGLLVFLGHPNVDGTLLVADLPSSRLVRISRDLLFTGEVVEDPRCPFVNPEAVALNQQTRELVVHNRGAQEIVKFKLVL